MNLKLHVWRQPGKDQPGAFEVYDVPGVSPDMSFLEMLDTLNERLTSEGQRPIAFEHDCREGICGMCGFMIGGEAHGPAPRATVCQTHMREFRDGEELWLEPWRASAFPVLQDLMVDRSALDRIVQAGGYTSVNAGSAPDGNAILVAKEAADQSFDAATCIGCGACVAACPNASAALFTAAKLSHLSHLPQGQPERYRRVQAMVERMDELGFGNCTMHGECEDSCPKGISISHIARMNRDFIWATLRGEAPKSGGGGD